MTETAGGHLRLFITMGHNRRHRGVIAWKPVGRTVVIANLFQVERTVAACDMSDFLGVFGRLSRRCVGSSRSGGRGRSSSSGRRSAGRWS
jgi:hypothetical protein